MNYTKVMSKNELTAELTDKLKTQPSKAPGLYRCWTCRFWPQVAREIREYLKMREAHQTTWNQRQLYDELVREYGYTVGVDGFYKHIKRCEPPSGQPPGRRADQREREMGS
jgi:hypothetical protein